MLDIDIDVDRHRVAERPRVSDRTLYTQLLEAHVENVNLRLSRALGGKQMIVGWEEWESDVESQDLQGGIPHPCRSRTNGLAPTSKY
jgi:hypothetical protein